MFPVRMFQCLLHSLLVVEGKTWGKNEPLTFPFISLEGIIVELVKCTQTNVNILVEAKLDNFFFFYTVLSITDRVQESFDFSSSLRNIPFYLFRTVLLNPVWLCTVLVLSSAPRNFEWVELTDFFFFLRDYTLRVSGGLCCPPCVLTLRLSFCIIIASLSSQNHLFQLSCAESHRRQIMCDFIQILV